MSHGYKAVDDWLAATLSGDAARLERSPRPAWSPDMVVGRIDFHGIAGVLNDLPGSIVDWPAPIVAGIRQRAIAQAMWELRHRQLLIALLTDLSASGVRVALLKGTALAYDLYPTPATRNRGDSDLLVSPGDLPRARRTLQRQGFVRAVGAAPGDDAFDLQEVWTLTCAKGLRHHVDLHWQTLNSPALDAILPTAECLDSGVALPRLCPAAMGLDRVRLMLHACIHRQINFASPYFVGERTYFSGDRLIWLYDLDLIARALTAGQWHGLCELALDGGVAAACLDGLERAEDVLGTPIPGAVKEALAAAPDSSRPAAYLRARQFGRAWRDFRAVPGAGRKLHYLRARTLPNTGFMREKYPRLAWAPVPLLYARRMVDLLRPRPADGVDR